MDNLCLHCLSAVEVFKMSPTQESISHRQIEIGITVLINLLFPLMAFTKVNVLYFYYNNSQNSNFNFKADQNN